MPKTNGGIIGPSNVPNPFIAKGVWKLRDAFNYIKAGLWPIPLGYQIPNSLRFNAGSTDYLSKNSWATATSDKIFTYSTWVKRSQLGSTERLFGAFAGSPQVYSCDLSFTSNNGYIEFTFGGASAYDIVTNAMFRDISAWYHVVLAVDTTQATDTNRIKIYVNNTLQTLQTANYPPQNTTYQVFRNNNANLIGSAWNGGAYYTGYMSETYFIDGQQLTPSSFGQTDSATGIWTPKAYTGTYGTNGFYLKFQDSSALGDDTSGNGNDFTANNLTSVDQSTDTCTNNFATLNPLVNYQAYPPVLTEGNLKNTSNANASNGGTSPSTIVVSQGKWYAEMKVGANKQDGTALGIVTDSYRFDYQNDAAFYTSASFSSVAYLGDGRKVISNTFSSYGATFTANDIIGIAVDLDNDTVTFYKNGVSQGVISTTLTGGYFICCYGYNSSVQEINFGSPPYTGGGYTDAGGFGNFSYQPPSGYYSLCTRTLAALG